MSVVAVAVLLFATTTSVATTPGSGGLGERVNLAPENDAFYLALADGERARQASRARNSVEVLEQYERAPMCDVSSAFVTTPLNGPCPEAEGEVGANDCDGDAPLNPLWMRSRPTTASAWTAWTNVDAGGCPADILPVLTAEDFRRLPIAPPVLTLQPDRGWVLVNKETIVMTERTEQTFRTELLGHGIDVIATPDKFTYDFGDGSSDLVTRSAGHSWPDHDTFHFYEELGTVQITLTTSWKGRYRVDGTNQWRDVIGTAETSVTSAPFTVEERRSHLVSGLCTDIPKPDDCD